jgi:hypothetical protein
VRQGQRPSNRKKCSFSFSQLVADFFVTLLLHLCNPFTSSSSFGLAGARQQIDRSLLNLIGGAGSVQFPGKCRALHPKEASLLGRVPKMEGTIQARRNMRELHRRLRKGRISPNFW